MGGESLNKNTGLWESDVTFLRQFSHLKLGRYIYIFLDPWSVVQIIIDAVCKSLGAVPVVMQPGFKQKTMFQDSPASEWGSEAERSN